jgi:transposase
MPKPRRFSKEFKRQVVQELLSSRSGSAELCRRYNIASGQLYQWKQQYARGRLNGGPSTDTQKDARIAQLEQMVGKLTMENEFLKKSVEFALEEAEEKEDSLPDSGDSPAASKEDAN